MGPEPSWQPNYVDLSDDRTVRLGGQCLICGARFESPVSRLDLDPAFGFAMQGSFEQELAELKYRTFAEFDAAYQEITFECPQCRRRACVDCWDDDHRMCGACVAASGLRRSPHRGIAADGPLADGRLRCVEHGQFADAAQPSWLDALLSAESQRSSDRPPDATDSSWKQQVAGAAPTSRGEPFPGAAAGPAFSMPLHQTGTLAYEPTTKIASMPDYASPSAYSGQAGQFDLPGSLPALSHDDGPYASPEGRVTSSKVKCPRCGAPNYDFVTNCTNCQLQLIQNCSMCGKLNPGHAHKCEFCGSSLDRPRGWGAIQDAVQPMTPTEARKATPRPAAPKKGRTLKHKASRLSAAAAAPTAPVRPEPFTIDPDTGALTVPSFLPASYFESSAVREEMYTPSVGEGFVYALERVITIVFWLLLLTIAAAVAAAELSPHANTIIRNATHIDIRLTLAHFGTWAHHMLHRSGGK